MELNDLNNTLISLKENEGLEFSGYVAASELKDLIFVDGINDGINGYFINLNDFYKNPYEFCLNELSFDETLFILENNKNRIKEHFGYSTLTNETKNIFHQTSIIGCINQDYTFDYNSECYINIFKEARLLLKQKN